MVNTVERNNRAVYSENRMKPTNSLFAKSEKLSIAQAGGTYGCHSVLEG
jgi:hypothetical protein